jgi:hypothetical protein
MAGPAGPAWDTRPVPARDPHRLPAGLPVPEDDGGADGLVGRTLPARELASTGGDPVDLARAAADLLVL